MVQADQRLCFFSACIVKSHNTEIYVYIRLWVHVIIVSVISNVLLKQ